MVLKGLGLFSEMVAEWSPSLLDALAPPVSCVKASAQMGRMRKQPRAFDWKDLVKQKWVTLPITKILHTWFSASLTKLENNSTVYISGRWFKKKKEKRRAEIFHAGEHGVGISPQQGDKLALRCLSPFSLSPFFLSLTYTRAARAQGTRGNGGSHRPRQDSRLCRDPPWRRSQGARLRLPPAGSPDRHQLNLWPGPAWLSGTSAFRP